MSSVEAKAWFVTMDAKRRIPLVPEVVAALKLHSGMKLREWIEDGRVVLEPVRDNNVEASGERR